LLPKTPKPHKLNFNFVAILLPVVPTQEQETGIQRR